MRSADLMALNEARRMRLAAIVITHLDSGSSQVVCESDVVADVLREPVEKAFRSGKSVLFEHDGKNLFLNVHVPPPRIVVIGAVHISQALAKMAAIAGYDLRIIDPRTAFATPERFDGVDLTTDWPEEALQARRLDAYTALVAVSHEPRIDDLPIIEALRAGCFYVGALGSRKTHARRVERLREAGVTDVHIARIDAPIGLDIAAQSPAEIAVAILGSVISAFRKRELGV